MMGSNDKPQDELFYAFNLNEIVPQDHLLREHLAPYYEKKGSGLITR